MKEQSLAFENILTLVKRVFHPPKHIALALLLAAALLFSQWMGMQHRIAHAHFQQTGNAYSPIYQNLDHKSSVDHSCKIFDAATVADSIHISPFVTVPLLNTHVLALWVAFLSWDAPCFSYFSSRAPPCS